MAPIVETSKNVTENSIKSNPRVAFRRVNTKLETEVIFLQPRTIRKTAEESLSCTLSVLHDAYRNEEWAKKLKDKIIKVEGLG